jgi:hypothetical protein
LTDLSFIVVTTPVEERSLSGALGEISCITEPVGFQSATQPVGS